MQGQTAGPLFSLGGAGRKGATLTLGDGDEMPPPFLVLQMNSLIFKAKLPASKGVFLFVGFVLLNIRVEKSSMKLKINRGFL